MHIKAEAPLSCRNSFDTVQLKHALLTFPVEVFWGFLSHQCKILQDFYKAHLYCIELFNALYFWCFAYASYFYSLTDHVITVSRLEHGCVFSNLCVCWSSILSWHQAYTLTSPLIIYKQYINNKLFRTFPVVVNVQYFNNNNFSYEDYEASISGFWYALYTVYIHVVYSTYSCVLISAYKYIIVFYKPWGLD